MAGVAVVPREILRPDLLIWPHDSMPITMRAARPTVLAVLAAGCILAVHSPAAPVASESSVPFAGMTLEVRQGRLVVADIRPGSAAAAAGLMTGDALLVVNGSNLIDLDPISAEAAVDILRKERGDEARLIVGRGAGTLGVALPLRLPIAGPEGPREPPATGSEAPDFSARTLKGETVSLRALRGKPVLVDFWAAWCPPCRDAIIPLRRIATEHGDGLIIVGVSLDDDPKVFEAFAYNHHLPGHQVLDGGWRGTISTLYGIPSTGIPYAILVDAKGRVVTAGTTLEEAEKAIVRLLAPAKK